MGDLRESSAEPVIEVPTLTPFLGLGSQHGQQGLPMCCVHVQIPSYESQKTHHFYCKSVVVAVTACQVKRAICRRLQLSKEEALKNLCYVLKPSSHSSTCAPQASPCTSITSKGEARKVQTSFYQEGKLPKPSKLTSLCGPLTGSG